MWHTHDELAFIDGLGSWSDGRTRRVDLLKGYIKGSKFRSHWARVDGLRCINYAISKLGEFDDRLDDGPAPS